MKTQKNRNLKLAHLTSSYFPKVGGFQVFVHNLATKMTEKGHKVVVITPARGGSDDKFYQYGIVRLNPLLNRILFMNFPVGKVYLESLLSKMQQRYGFDLWQVTVGYPLGAASADFFNRNKIPCVLRCAGEDIQMLPELGYGYRLNKRVNAIVGENYKKFTALITAGNGTKKDYLSAGVSEDKIFVIPNGADCAKFEIDVDRKKIRDELGVNGGQKLIITVGRNHPKKGFKYIPQIMEQLLKRGARFKWLLVGKGCENIKSLANKEDVGKYLIIREVNPDISDKGEPEIPNRKLIGYYKASDIFVFPTFIELFAKVLIEAMAAGLAVVTTDAPGVDDIIKNNENGLKCNVGDVGGLTEAILNIFSDEALAKRLSENALGDAKLYDWPRVTDMYLELYKKVSGDGWSG